MIYMTQFDPETKQCTGPSVPCGADNMEVAKMIFGPAWLTCSKRTVVYERIALTDYILSR